MEEILVDSWEQFVDITSQLEDWAFRGHADANWSLLSSLSRYLDAYIADKKSWQLREERAIRIFRRKAHNYLSDASLLDNDLRCLALMQHHGAPTRLIDFTKSPFVAAFFALEKALGNSAVYALNTPYLWSAAPKGNAKITRDRIDPRVTGNFQKYFLQNTYDMVWIGEPAEMDRRLVAQSGTFVVPGELNKPLDVILQGYKSKKILLKKITFPQKVRKEGMKALYRMNVTNATLFPDLDGLAKSISAELEVLWQVAVSEAT